MSIKLKTLDDLKKRWNYLRNKPLRELEGLMIKELLMEHKLLRQEVIKWIKEAKQFVTGLHEDNAGIVIGMWMESMDIKEGDLKCQ